MRRPYDALAYGAASVIFVGALPGGVAAGALGQWASAGMHTAFGHAAWLAPAWLADAAWRAWVGAPREPRRVASWAFHSVVACMTLNLCRGHGGWVGEQCASILWTAIGFGAHVIAFGVWIGAGLRLLGPRRVEQVAGHAYVLSRQVLAHRPMLLLPASTQPLRAQIVDAYAEPAPVLVRAPVPVKAEPPAPPPTPVMPPPPQQQPVAPRAPSHWTLPDIGMLPPPVPHPIDHDYLAKLADNVQRRLDTFKLTASVAPAAEQGSLVYRLEATPGTGQKIKAITDRHVDLEAHYKGVRFVDLPGTGKLGIEIPVPESHRTPILMREVLESPAWTDSSASLPLALGVTTSGAPMVVDLADFPHLLVAGTSGAGKSIGLHIMLTSLLFRNSPDEVRFALVDPKQVELADYDGLPHLFGSIATTQVEAIELLQKLVDEMESRYRMFKDHRVRNIASYNACGRARLPRIVVVCDEYADLTMKNREQVEALVCKLAQKARAAGIHIILATQRPSTQVITGDIKANFLGRVAYQVENRHDSDTVLGTIGAEKLMGKGDSLCKIPVLGTELIRILGAFIDADNGHVLRICDAWRAQTTSNSSQRQCPPPLPVRMVAEHDVDDACITVDDSAECDTQDGSDDSAECDTQDGSVSEVDEPADLYETAVAWASKQGAVSIGRMQRDLSVGFAKAQKLFEKMKEEGLVKSGGPNNTHIYIGPN